MKLAVDAEIYRPLQPVLSPRKQLQVSHDSSECSPDSYQGQTGSHWQVLGGMHQTPHNFKTHRMCQVLLHRTVPRVHSL